MTAIAPIASQFDLAVLREQQFPITHNTTYLNNAGIAPLPKRTADTIQTANEQMMLYNESIETWMMGSVAAFNEAVKSLINARNVSEIVGISTTSFGLNMVAQAFPWKTGDNTILCDIEFPSNVYPWLRAGEVHGVEVRLIPPMDGGLTLDSLKAHTDEHTRLVTVSAIQFLTGHKTDLAAIGEFCHEHNITFVVDAIQAAGHMSIDVQAMRIDTLAASGHKSLMGPAGQGFLYVRNDLANAMTPALIGPTAVEDYAHWLKYDMTLVPGAARFGMGTYNLSGMIGLTESLRMIAEIGVQAIDNYTTSLADYTTDRLRSAGYEVITPAAHGPIVTFKAADDEAATNAIMESLKRQRIFVAKHWDKHDVAHIRVSVHCFNNSSDIDHLLQALKEKIS